MTDYGRGQGSEPWHPEDPLFGDDGWRGQDGQAAQSPSYGGQQQHYSQQPQQQNQYGDWGNGQQSGYDQGQQHYAQGQQQYGGPDQQQYYDQGGQQYQGQNNGQQYQGQNNGQQYQGQNNGQQYQGQNGQQYNGGWDTGQQGHGQGHGPYGSESGDPYGGRQAPYGGQQSDYYGTPDAYPPPQPPSRRRTEREPEPAPPTDWDPGPDQGEHAFFSGGSDDDDDFDDDPSDGKRGKGKGKSKGKGKTGKKSRNGCACLVVSLVLVGGVGGGGYYGYQFYQSRFGEAPDFAGEGTSQTVMVEIAKGSGGYEIGQKLKAAGVVKSVDAFVSAQSQNPEGLRIEAGVYLLKKEMSAESAVNMMLDPKSQNNMIVAPGQRNSTVYVTIDQRLGLKKGTTANVAKEKYESLGLPDWANSNDDIKDPLEGFLYPHTYAAAKGMKPEDVLKKMVAQAKAKYAEYDLEAKARELKLDNPLEVVTVASLVQAEGKTSDDYRKMAEVVYNRLDLANPETYGALQFDSTFNYLKNESNIDISESEIKSNKDPYNTYTNKGLPPGPIGNPGDVAIKATLDPTDDGWYYFVATDGVKKTEFAKTHDEFQRLKDKFNARSGS
ncbi:endolytic transglycosylase MltG [Streptomyces xiangluensis]|uniref:Endolytic murein transglycosylase n=1 Tax=Streptomyces xiangluensis TaxID=2665720 RepID=A0ABV8YU58_9ACTN